MNRFGGETDEYRFGHIKFKEVMEHPMGGGQRELGKMNWILSKDFLVWGMESTMCKLSLKPRNLMSLLRCQASSMTPGKHWHLGSQ